MSVSADGLQLFALWDDNFSVRHMLTNDLPAPFDISSMTLVDDLASVFQYNINGGYMVWSQDGGKVFETIGQAVDTVYQYSSVLSGGGITTKLFHDDNERLSTTSEGVDVTGIVKADGLNAQYVLPDYETSLEPVVEYEGGLIYNSTESRPSFFDGLTWGALSTQVEFDTHVDGSDPLLKHPAADVTFDDTVFQHGITETQSAIDYLHGELLIREVISSGLLTGGYPIVLNATFPTTHIDVPVGEGRIVDGYTDRSHPTGYDIAWLASTIDLTSYFTDPVGVVTIYVTPNQLDLNDSTINVIEGIASTTLYRGNVILGHVFYHASVIETILNSPIQVNEVANTLHDFIEYNSPEENTRGVTIEAITGAPSIWCESGTVFHIGGNVDSGDPTNPNIIPFPALGDSTTLEPFDIHLQSGENYLVGQTVIPELYESAPDVVTALTGSKATIHYMFRTAGGELVLQLGQVLYASGKEARDSLLVDIQSYVRFIGSESTLFRAQIYFERNVADFSDSSTAGIVYLRGVGAGVVGVVSLS